MQHGVLLDARMIKHSGIGTYLQNLIPYIVDKINLTVLGNSSALKDFSWSKQVQIIEMKSKIYSIKEQFELLYKIPALSLFWSPHFNVPIIPTKAKKQIVTVHDVFHLTFSKILSIPKRIYAKKLINSAVQNSDRIITVSNFSKQEIINHTGTDSDKIVVIYNGINKHLFNPDKDIQESTMIKKKYNLPEKFILYVGNVKPHKNLRRLLEAYLEIQDKIPDFSLVIVGETEDFLTADNQLFNFIKGDRGLRVKVHITGHIEMEDIAKLYRSAAVFVFPSLYEGFGLPPLEAMACGCPTVISNIGSLSEVCGEAASYFDPNHSSSIAEKILHSITDQKLREKLKNKGLEQAKKFNWIDSANRHIEVIHELLN